MGAAIPEPAESAGDDEDPHLAGLAAQQRYLDECRAAGLPAYASEADKAYWSAYKTASQWGDI